MDKSLNYIKERQIRKQIRDQIFAYAHEKRKHFHVFTAEAGLGKTYACEEALAELWKQKPDVKTLFVKLFKDRKDKKPSFKHINEEAGCEIAFPIDTDVMKDINSIKDKDARDAAKKRLQNAPVIIITHALYIRLCRLSDDSERLKFFTEGRTILIIDEEPKMLDTYDVSIRSIDKVREFMESHPNLPIKENYQEFRAIDMFDIITGNLKEVMNSIPYNKMVLYDPFAPHKKKVRYETFTSFDLPCSLESLRRAIFDSINTEISDTHYDIEKERLRVLKDFANAILVVWRKLFNYKVNTSPSYGYSYMQMDDVIATHDKLSAFNDRFRFIMLNNNVLLDASAKFNYIYKLQPALFNVVDQERVIEHSRNTIYYYDKNTTKSAKDRNPDFYNAIMNHVKTNCTIGDKILIVGKKDEVNNLLSNSRNDFSDAEVDFVNFQYLRGKNDWGDYNKCYIIHTPNMSYSHFYFLYEIYKCILVRGFNFSMTRNLSLQKRNCNIYFTDEEMEQVRKTYIASNIYQAIMRINRNRQHAAQIYIINSDHEVVDMVKEQMLHIRFERFSIDIPKPQRKPYDNSKRLRDSHIGKFVDFLIGNNFGEYEKEKIRMDVGCKNKKSFNEKVIQRALNYLVANKYVTYTYGDGGILELDDRTIKIEHKKIIITRRESHP